MDSSDTNKQWSYGKGVTLRPSWVVITNNMVLVSEHFPR